MDKKQLRDLLSERKYRAVQDTLNKMNAVDFLENYPADLVIHILETVEPEKWFRLTGCSAIRLKTRVV